MKTGADILTIGELARQSGVNLETIRYYERRGLIPKPGRSVSGYRKFSPEFVKRIHFIKHAQKLGFTLSEIKELLALRVKPRTACAEVRSQADEKIADIELKIRSLEAMKTALRRLISTCSGGGPISECPILEALDEEEET